MTSPRGGHTAGDNSFARDAGTQTTKAVLLVAVAVVVGIVMLSRTGTSNAGSTSTPPPSPSAVAKTTTTTTASTTTTTTVPLPAPDTVKVVVFNGTTAPHGAGYFTTKLHAVGYNTLAPENASATTVTTSAVYAIVASYVPSAQAIARTLGLPASAVQSTLPSNTPIPASVITATSPDIAVLVGSDISGQSLSGGSTTTSGG